jgi:ERCC4-type nuclease
LPSEFLKRLPGIDSNNINKITRKFRTIVDVSKCTEDELKQVIGAKNAKELR